MLGVSVMQQGRERCHAPLHDVRALAAELAALTRAAELSGLGRDDLKEKWGNRVKRKASDRQKKGGKRKGKGINQRMAWCITGKMRANQTEVKNTLATMPGKRRPIGP